MGKTNWATWTGVECQQGGLAVAMLQFDLSRPSENPLQTLSKGKEHSDTRAQLSSNSEVTFQHCSNSVNGSEIPAMRG